MGPAGRGARVHAVVTVNNNERDRIYTFDVLTAKQKMEKMEKKIPTRISNSVRDLTNVVATVGHTHTHTQQNNQITCEVNMRLM